MDPSVDERLLLLEFGVTFLQVLCVVALDDDRSFYLGSGYF